MLGRLRASELQHGVLSSVTSQLEVVATVLQKPNAAVQGGAGGSPGVPLDFAAELQPFPASLDYPSSEVRIVNVSEPCVCCTITQNMKSTRSPA